MIQAIVEIPQGSIFKYEKFKGGLIVDRILNQPCPYNYGYIPNTLCGDGDPIDVFILGDTPIYPNTHVNIKVIGALICTDNGEEDNKIIAVMDNNDGPAQHMGTDIIRTYLNSYKKGFIVADFVNKDKALELIDQSKCGG